MKRTPTRPRVAAVRIRAARTADVPALLAMMVEFNRIEGIAWRPREMERALRQLLRQSDLGMVLLAEQAKQAVGYAIATYNYDLEFAGRDAFVTELFVQRAQRRHGVARRLLDTLIARLQRARTNAVHLVVRPANRPARALYARVGFALIPRLIMTKLLPARQRRVH